MANAEPPAQRARLSCATETIAERLVALRRLQGLYPWQRECLQLHGALAANRNFIFACPTSSGKTLVAEAIALRTLLEDRRDVIYILPLVSVVEEKVAAFQEVRVCRPGPGRQ